jgi:hypothetical protein
MSDTERVRAWRQRLKEGGLVPMTIWVRPDTKARYQDLAARQHRSGSELVQLALDAYRLDQATVAATVSDTEQLRALIRDELDQTTAIMTVTVTATVTETITEMLPDIVAAAVRGLVTATATDTDTDTAESEPPQAPPAPAVSDTDTAPITETTVPPRARQATPLGQPKLTTRQAAALRAKRQRGVPIKALMEEYGLSKATVHRYLKTSH